MDDLTKKKRKPMPNLAMSVLMLMTFGNLGTSMAFSLQSSQMSRIFQTIGADPTKLGFFFILPPLAGMVVQPLVGWFSDHTWIPKLGRRMPYLIVGSIVAIIVMFLLPNSGSFGFGYGSMLALWFGAISILFMDLMSNMSMQPFKMIIGDMVNEKQKDKAWAWQTIWSNIGSFAAYLFPFGLSALGVANVAAKGVVPDSVRFSFYLGAIILGISSLFTVFKVKEYDPKTYNEYHGIDSEAQKKQKTSLVSILSNAPKVFWTLGLVEFFSWASFQYLWTYAPGALSANIWHTINPTSAGFQAAGNWYGVLSAVQTVAAILYGYVLSHLNDKTRKPFYSLGLVGAAAGFLMLAFCHTKLLSIIAFIFIGIGWVTINSIPFTILTNALDGQHDGTYIGMFNCWICLPQICASVASFALYPMFSKMSHGDGASMMILFGAVLFIIGAFSVWVIKETKGLSAKKTDEEAEEIIQ